MAESSYHVTPTAAREAAFFAPDVLNTRASQARPEALCREAACHWLIAAGAALDELEGAAPVYTGRGPLETIARRLADRLWLEGPAELASHARYVSHVARRERAYHPHHGALRRLCLCARRLARVTV